MRYLWVLSLIVPASEMLLHFDSKNSVTLHGKNRSLGITETPKIMGSPNNDPSTFDICS